MSRRVPIVAKLLVAYLVPTVATFAGFGYLAHQVARRALEAELGRRLSGLAATAALQIADENLAILVPGDEGTRTFRNAKRRLVELRDAGGLGRVFVFAADGTSRVDTEEVPIGQTYHRLEADRAEVRAALAGTPTASILFRGLDGELHKSAYAALGGGAFVVGVEGAAPLYAQLAWFRQTLFLVGAAGMFLFILVSVAVARWITRPVRQLERAAARIGQGDLRAQVTVPSRDEIGAVAETLEDMRVQLVQRDERMQMMLAGIAHEVRNPLGGMELYVGLLRDELTASPGHREMLARIQRELGHLKTIVSDFLEYARRPAPELAPHDLTTLVAEIAELLTAPASARKVQVLVEAHPARAAVDAGQLRRALLNLGQNAVQACPDDGSGVVTLGCTMSDGKVRLTVADTGAGISAETRAQMFTPFYTTKQSGTGLGLAFVRDIARDHGATLDVESAPGRTVFSLTLKEVS